MYSAMHILLFGLICDPDHLCFGRTTYNNINGPGGPFMLVIIGPAGPFMYPDQISRYRPLLKRSVTAIIMLSDYDMMDFEVY